MNDVSEKHPKSIDVGNDLPPDLEIRPAETDDANAIRALFEKVFKEHMSPEHWHWKYARDMSCATIAFKDGRLVAHYGGVGLPILQEGRKATAVQITDLMVDPDARQGVRSHSPFFQVSKSFLETYAGYDKPFDLVYGFPSERATILSEKLGILVRVGRMYELTWNLSGDEARPAGEIIELTNQNYQRYENKINRLWARFGTHFEDLFICVKDAEYFRWRFLEHPAKKYSLYLVQSRLLKKPKQLLVFRHDAEQSMLMDFVGNSLDIDATITLAKSIVCHEGNSRLVTWCSDAYRREFAKQADSERALQIAIPANTWSKAAPADIQMNKWWFMPGDIDYL